MIIKMTVIFQNDRYLHISILSVILDQNVWLEMVPKWPFFWKIIVVAFQKN